MLLPLFCLLLSTPHMLQDVAGGGGCCFHLCLLQPIAAILITSAMCCRLMLEVVEAAAAAIGQERVALRLSPYTDNRGIRDDSIQRAIDKTVWLVQVGAAVCY
jgi:hypothetical protein